MNALVRRMLLACLLVSLVLPTAAQEEPLPRVLVIGDSVYTQHARGVSAALKDKAVVAFSAWPRDLVANSHYAIEHFDRLIGLVDASGNAVPEDKWPKWDLIHVNVGLGDLIYRVPGIEDFRVLPIDAGGVVATSPEQYRKNVDLLITRLKQTGAEVVWASTTPIRASRSNVFRLGSEIEYNAIASEVMAKHRVPINDMYTYTTHLINMDKPAGHGADPFDFDRKPIHMPIVRAIERHFGFDPLPESDEEKAVKEAIAELAPARG